MLVYWSDGTTTIATAWMYGKNVAATAGHAVYSSDRGDWAKSVTLYPGKNESSLPYGSVSVSKMTTPSAWKYNAISYNADTVGGVSGSPVYKSNGKVIAVHAYGVGAFGPANSGAKINTTTYKFLQSVYANGQSISGTTSEAGAILSYAAIWK